MSLISAGSISLDSTFKSTLLQFLKLFRNERKGLRFLIPWLKFFKYIFWTGLSTFFKLSSQMRPHWFKIEETVICHHKCVLNLSLAFSNGSALSSWLNQCTLYRSNRCMLKFVTTDILYFLISCSKTPFHVTFHPLRSKKNYKYSLFYLLHRKKRFEIFPAPDGMSLPNSPWAGIMTS
jgi:hypothetical protein